MTKTSAWQMQTNRKHSTVQLFFYLFFSFLETEQFKIIQKPRKIAVSPFAATTYVTFTHKTMMRSNDSCKVEYKILQKKCQRLVGWGENTSRVCFVRAVAFLLQEEKIQKGCCQKKMNL